MEILIGTSQSLIAIAVAVIAWQQYKLTQHQTRIDSQRIKHELFDRRIDFINQTEEYIKPWTKEEIIKFPTHIQKSKLLFPELSIAQLVIMNDIGNKFFTLDNSTDIHKNEILRERKERLEADILEKLNTHYSRFVKSVESLVKIEDYKIQ